MSESPAAGDDPRPELRRRLGRSKHTSVADVQVERTRARTGALVVIGGDVIILLATGAAVWAIKSDMNSSAAIVSILTSAFTTVGTMTTAYFGIRAMANTAQYPTNGPAADGTPT